MIASHASAADARRDGAVSELIVLATVAGFSSSSDDSIASTAGAGVGRGAGAGVGRGVAAAFARFGASALLAFAAEPPWSFFFFLTLFAMGSSLSDELDSTTTRRRRGFGTQASSSSLSLADGADRRVPVKHPANL